jgi:hypothetical protein
MMAVLDCLEKASNGIVSNGVVVVAAKAAKPPNDASFQPDPKTGANVPEPKAPVAAGWRLAGVVAVDDKMVYSTELGLLLINGDDKLLV